MGRGEVPVFYSAFGLFPAFHEFLHYAPCHPAEGTSPHIRDRDRHYNHISRYHWLRGSLSPSLASLSLLHPRPPCGDSLWLCTWPFCQRNHRWCSYVARSTYFALAHVGGT